MDNGTVAVSGLEIAVDKPGGSLTFQLTPLSESAPKGVPALSGGQPLQYFTLTADAASAERYETVTIYFRIDEAALPEGRTPADVTLYHYTDGEWVAVPTSYDPDADRYAAAVESLSPFAVGSASVTTAPSESIEIVSADLSTRSLQPGGTTTVTVKLTNQGSTTATRSVPFGVDGTTLVTRNVTLAPGDSRVIAFEATFETAGEYRLRVGSSTVGTLTVTAPATATASETPTRQLSPPSTPTAVAQPSVWFGWGAALVFLLGGLLLAVRRGRGRDA